MKKIIITISLFTVCLTSFSQYDKIGTQLEGTKLALGLGNGLIVGSPNYGRAALHIRAANNTIYSSKGGQQLMHLETEGAPGDFLRILNASGSNNEIFVPTIMGNARNNESNSLLLLGNIQSSQDLNSRAPIMGFNVRKNFLVAGDSDRVGGRMGNRVERAPLFQWSNFDLPQMTIVANGDVGMGTVNPEANLEVKRLNRLANFSISNNFSNFHIGVSGNDGDYGIERGSAIIRMNSYGQTKHKGHLYINTGNSNSSNNSFRSIIIGSSNNTLVVSDNNRVGVGLSNSTNLYPVAQPSHLFHINSRNLPSVRFEDLPTKNCGFILMADENGIVYRSQNSGIPCMASTACNTNIANVNSLEVELITLKKKYDDLEKRLLNVENLGK